MTVEENLSDAAKSAISFLWNTPKGITVKQARRAMKEKFGQRVYDELKDVFEATSPPPPAAPNSNASPQDTP